MTEQDYVIVRNPEDGHALWPAFRPVPPGWTLVEGPAPQEACLERMSVLWPDTRPRSLREATD